MQCDVQSSVVFVFVTCFIHMQHPMVQNSHDIVVTEISSLSKEGVVDIIANYILKSYFSFFSIIFIIILISIFSNKEQEYAVELRYYMSMCPKNENRKKSSILFSQVYSTVHGHDLCTRRSTVTIFKI